MTSPSRPRGPLPRRVYWARRMLVAATAAALVVGVGQLLDRGSDATSGPAQATQVAAEPTAAVDGPTLQAKDSSKPGKKKTKKKSKKSDEPKQAPLPEPTGRCVAPDVQITPVVKEAVAGQPVRVGLQLRTRVSLACTWRVSPRSVTLKITSGKDDVWSSRQCPRVVPKRDVILRAETPVYAGVLWSAKRSDDDCSALTEWALPGWYHLAVAPLGGEPADVQFQLTRPEPQVVTASPSPGAKNRKQKQP